MRIGLRSFDVGALTQNLETQSPKVPPPYRGQKIAFLLIKPLIKNAFFGFDKVETLLDNPRLAEIKNRVGLRSFESERLGLQSFESGLDWASRFLLIEDWA